MQKVILRIHFSINKKTQAEGFYKKLDYETSYDIFMEDGIPHILMTKMLS
ncbi:GNAT family N-acetyltransferase [Bacillus cereus]